MIQILVAEDDRLIAELIEANLEQQGYSCVCVYDGETAARKMEQETFDLCLLDIMLPKISGYELLAYARELGYPVIFITAMGRTQDKVKGLKSGADDYITKPFEIVEMMARVESVLRRYRKIDTVFSEGNVEINLASRKVTKDGKPVSLTAKEFDLLVLLVQNKNVALYRDSIYENVWREEYQGESRTIDLHIQRLRAKLDWKDKIQSVYKVGYRLC